MGAEYMETTIHGKPDDERYIHNRAHEIIKQCLYDYGHAGYTGTFAECNGVETRQEAFNDLAPASEFLQDTADKWGPALLVKVRSDEEDYWLMGAWCSS